MCPPGMGGFRPASLGGTLHARPDSAALISPLNHPPLIPLFSLVKVDFPEIEIGVKPRHRVMSAFEQRVREQDRGMERFEEGEGGEGEANSLTR